MTGSECPARWHLYVIRTLDGFLYSGISTNVPRRFKEHLSQGSRTAKYLMAHKPGRLAFSMVIGDKSLALRVEYSFKRLAKKEKERIVKAKRLVFDKESGRIRI